MSQQFEPVPTPNEITVAQKRYAELFWQFSKIKLEGRKEPLVISELEKFLDEVGEQVMNQIAKENNWPQEPEQPEAESANKITPPTSWDVYRGAIVAPSEPQAEQVPGVDPNWPLASFDGVDWAKEFVKRFPTVPHDMAHVWFANALMRGFDEHARRTRAPSVDDLREDELSELRKAKAALAESYRKMLLFRVPGESLTRLESRVEQLIAERDKLAERCRELEAQLAAKGEPEQDDWRELKPGEKYSGPGQVRDSEAGEWRDVRILCVDSGIYPFIVRTDTSALSCYKFARVRRGEEGKRD